MLGKYEEYPYVEGKPHEHHVKTCLQTWKKYMYIYIYVYVYR